MRRFRPGTIVATAAVAAASAALFVVSRGKWSDAIIDSGREWIVPDALARGGLLYRDVVYWFGPFTPYFQAAFLSVLGSGFATLVVAGAVTAGAALAVLFWALRKVTGRWEAALWTALAVPVLIFMPEAGGPLLGMGYRIWQAAIFTLAAVTAVSADSPRRREVLAGLLCALAGLCRTEWGIAALAASFASIGVRSGFRREAWRSCATAAVIFAAVFGGVLAAFVAAAGWGNVVGDGHVLLTGLPPETRTFLLRFSGVADWRVGAAEGLNVAAGWGGLLLAICAVAVRKRGPAAVRRFLVPVALCVGLMTATGFAVGWTVKPYSGAPWISLVGLLVALFWSRGPGRPLLAGCGLAGLVLSYRRPFHIADSGYVGPPLLFAIVCAAGLAELALRSGWAGVEVPESGRRLYRGCLGLLVAGAFAARLSLYGADERVAIAGTQGMLSARPELAARLTGEADRVRRSTRPLDGLAVLPEGEILNYLSGRQNPLRYKLYLPGYLSSANESRIIEDFERAVPKAIVILYRPTGEYGPGRFGEDYGKRLKDYLDAHYDMQDSPDRDRVQSRVGSWSTLGLRRMAPRPGGSRE